MATFSPVSTLWPRTTEPYVPSPSLLNVTYRFIFIGSWVTHKHTSNWSTTVLSILTSETWCVLLNSHYHSLSKYHSHQNCAPPNLKTKDVKMHCLIRGTTRTISPNLNLTWHQPKQNPGICRNMPEPNCLSKGMDLSDIQNLPWCLLRCLLPSPVELKLKVLKLKKIKYFIIHTCICQISITCFAPSCHYQLC
jgi:hypothetical protein